MAYLETEQRNRRITELAESGTGPTEIARQMGLTKNVVTGIIHRHAPHLVIRSGPRGVDTGMTPKGVPFTRGLTREQQRERREVIAAERAEVAEINADVRAFAAIDDGMPIPTLRTRLDALHARMDALLAETRGSQNYLTAPLRPLRAW